MSNAQSHKKNILEFITHISKAVAKDNLRTPIREKSLPYIFYLETRKKGQRRLQHRLSVIQALFEQHFPISFEIDKAYNVEGLRRGI